MPRTNAPAEYGIRLDGDLVKRTGDGPWEQVDQ